MRCTKCAQKPISIFGDVTADTQMKRSVDTSVGWPNTRSLQPSVAHGHRRERSLPHGPGQEIVPGNNDKLKKKKANLFM